MDNLQFKIISDLIKDEPTMEALSCLEGANRRIIRFEKNNGKGQLVVNKGLKKNGKEKLIFSSHTLGVRVTIKPADNQYEHELQLHNESLKKPPVCDSGFITGLNAAP